MKKKNICIRPATTDDCRDVFVIISDPVVRHATFKQRAIPWDEHQRWFQSALKNPDRLLFIIEDNDNNTLGMLRFDIQKEHADVSIVLNRTSRGCGYGTLALESGCEKIFRQKGITVFRAHVKTGNIPSCKAFAKSGFVHSGTTTIEGAEADIFTYTIADYATNTL